MMEESSNSEQNDRVGLSYWEARIWARYDLEEVKEQAHHAIIKNDPGREIPKVRTLHF